MSFRLTDLKKSVRKAPTGYRVTPVALEGRPHEFRIQFILQQLEAHLGQPRRMLDPNTLLDFIGDNRLGRCLLATLSQWYRVRPRTFVEVLGSCTDGGWQEWLPGLGICGAVDLRAYLYSAINRQESGYLDPDSAPLFWASQPDALHLKQEELRQLMLIDSLDEAILVRTGPRPSVADVMAAYNLRAHTTLLRCAAGVTLVCDASPALVEVAARSWAAALEVEWRIEGKGLHLSGREDALGSWTRHGRRLERAALELLALSDLKIRELKGAIEVSEKTCGLQWKMETLAALGAGRGASFSKELPGEAALLASLLRRERDRRTGPAWRIRLPSHILGVDDGIFLPHLEARRGDLGFFLRAAPAPGAEVQAKTLLPFQNKIPVALVSGLTSEPAPVTLYFPGEAPLRCLSGEILAALSTWLDGSNERTATATGASHELLRSAA